MKIELKRITYNERLSEETFNFAADVWIDGNKAGDVRNNGTGGCHIYNSPMLTEKIAAQAKILYPDETFEVADHLVSELLTEWLRERDLKKMLGKRILYTRADKKGIYNTKVLTAERKAQLLAQVDKIKDVWHADKVLNVMPFPEALAIYVADAKAGA